MASESADVPKLQRGWTLHPPNCHLLPVAGSYHLTIIAPNPRLWRIGSGTFQSSTQLSNDCGRTEFAASILLTRYLFRPGCFEDDSFEQEHDLDVIMSRPKDCSVCRYIDGATVFGIMANYLLHIQGSR